MATKREKKEEGPGRGGGKDEGDEWGRGEVGRAKNGNMKNDGRGPVVVRSGKRRTKFFSPLRRDYGITDLIAGPTWACNEHRPRDYAL
jgi:hypothetical protein